MIERVHGDAQGRSSASAWKDLVWAVATAPNKSGAIAEQTRGTLARIDEHLAALGTDKTRIVNATVYMNDMSMKASMDDVWCEWIGPDKANWPQRACVGAELAPGDSVEIVVIAVRGGE
jgi:enamine deaminase RidA (YjgF/YER057c/UK114 family)